MEFWKEITSDKVIIGIVRNGLKIDFESEPNNDYVPQIPYKSEDIQIISEEIAKLLNKGVIIECGREQGDFLSTVFTRKKKDGNMRTILNLKYLNKHVTYNHFKMESLLDVFKIIQPNCWMASVDLKDAFYSVPIHEEHQKYFKFQWLGKIYKFLGMPNGYGEAMRIFTKILKPPFSILRNQGLLSVTFVDDSYLQGKTKDECTYNVNETILYLLKSLGFTIHTKKSILEPTQSIEFLGFIIDSTTMSVKINAEKSKIIINKIELFLENTKPSIRDLASIIGTLVSLFPAMPFGKLYYRNLENEKMTALKLKKGNYNAKLQKLGNEAIKELQWWLKNIPLANRAINLPEIDFTITTDASEQGWGATDGSTPTGGRWVQSIDHHINYLELKAIYYGIKSYRKEWIGAKHLRIRSDNTTAIAYINNMGGTVSSKCNNLAKVIWEFCISENIWISAEHIPGTKNSIADFMSRSFNDNTEWQLSTELFQKIIKQFSIIPTIDLFASHLNKQLKKYVS